MGRRCHSNDNKVPWSAVVYCSSSPELHVLSFAENMVFILFGRKAQPEAFLFFFFFFSLNWISIIYKCKIPSTTKRWSNVFKLCHSKRMAEVYEISSQCSPWMFPPVLKTYYNSKIFQSNWLSLFSGEIR